MLLSIIQIYQPHKFRLILICTITIILGIYPVFAAKTVANLIDQKSDAQYIIYCAFLITQSVLLRTQEFLLQNLQATILPKLRFQLKHRFALNDIIVQENISKIARFASNLWSPCFILKSLTLIISTTIIMLEQPQKLLLSWIIFVASTGIISLAWQPDTKDIINRQHKINNKFLATIKVKNQRIQQACILANVMVNNIIYKQQAIKTIIICTLLGLLTYSNWQMFLANQSSMGNTLMLLHLSIGISEIIWWLQHELCNLRVEWQSFCAARHLLITSSI